MLLEGTPRKRARAAIGRLSVGKVQIGIPNLGERFGKNAEKDKEFKEEFGLWRPVGESPDPDDSEG